jgi:hypothetical protein
MTQEKINREVKRKAAVEQANRSAASKAYETWLVDGRRKAKEPATIIIDWAAQFTASESWTEILNLDPPIDEVSISSRITYTHPPSRFPGEEEQDTEYFFLNRDGEVFVHQCIKYGKSYPAYTVELMLEHAAPPVIVLTADAIKDDKVLSIIAADIKQTLARLEGYTPMFLGSRR